MESITLKTPQWALSPDFISYRGFHQLSWKAQCSVTDGVAGRQRSGWFAKPPLVSPNHATFDPSSGRRHKR